MINSKSQNKPEPAEFLLYQTEDGQTRLEVRLQDETAWLTQKRMAELFQKNVCTINEHIQNIFDEGELTPESVIRKFRITADDGKQYNTQHYNLDVIISVGYRVKSHRGTQFRIWAIRILREFIIKGFAMDAEKENMGFTHWVGSRSSKSEAVIAKNYLIPEELDTLNRIVNAYPCKALPTALNAASMVTSARVGWA